MLWQPQAPPTREVAENLGYPGLVSHPCERSDLLKAGSQGLCAEKAGKAGLFRKSCLQGSMEQGRRGERKNR